MVRISRAAAARERPKECCHIEDRNADAARHRGARGRCRPASERAPVEPTAPSFVRELGRAETATVGGTVVELHRESFVLADPEDGRLRVDADHLRLDGLAPGEMITVTGRLDDGKLEAGHALREDGSVVVRDTAEDE